MPAISVEEEAKVEAAMTGRLNIYRKNQKISSESQHRLHRTVSDSNIANMYKNIEGNSKFKKGVYVFYFLLI